MLTFTLAGRMLSTSLAALALVLLTADNPGAEVNTLQHIDLEAQTLELTECLPSRLVFESRMSPLFLDERTVGRHDLLPSTSSPVGNTPKVRRPRLQHHDRASWMQKNW